MQKMNNSYYRKENKGEESSLAFIHIVCYGKASKLKVYFQFLDNFNNRV